MLRVLELPEEVVDRGCGGGVGLGMTTGRTERTADHRRSSRTLI